VSNHAYVGIWVRDPSEELLLDRFERLLECVPLSSARPGFTSLVARAVSPSEAPLAEYAFPIEASGPPDVIAAAREHFSDDVEYEVSGYWDLWQYRMEPAGWVRGPEPLLIICRGGLYDDGVAGQSGQFAAHLGFEHLFTGHANLLGAHEPRLTPAEPVEAEFLARMTQEKHLNEYYDKTRENIQQLFTWLRAVEQALPIERYQLWSEGEENLEARLDEILAVH
jgi:hypothetical protein